MNKVEKFKEELDLIKNPRIRGFAEEAIEIMPDYFFSVPASSSGKYHPQYALGEGGLLRHTKAAVRIAFELFRLDWWSFTDDDRDLIIVSLIMHDGWKSGAIQQKYTVTEHPLISAKMIDEKLGNNAHIDYPMIVFICDAIETHMGQWTNDYKTGVKVLNTPVTDVQKFVHLADYLASRKCLEVNFDAELSKQ